MLLNNKLNYFILKIKNKKILLAISSGCLLTLSFPNIGFDFLIWFAFIPFLICIDGLSYKKSFHYGFLTGLTHYLSLLYWLIPTMKIYGMLPIVVCVPLLFLLAAYLAVYFGILSFSISFFCKKKSLFFFIVPFLWVCLEYCRTYFFSGFPWALIGYSQYKNLSVIQISELTGIYGLSFIIIFSNVALFLAFLQIKKYTWYELKVNTKVNFIYLLSFIILITSIIVYGKFRIKSIEKLYNSSKSKVFTVAQGNINQFQKWDPLFQFKSIEKYINLSLSAKPEKPDLIVWPETATPFFFLHNKELTKIVKNCIIAVDTNFFIGSPSFKRKDNINYYFNSAYFIDKDGKVKEKYDKVHLVPFGEYVPLKKILFFVGKIVAQVGDFTPGKKGQSVSITDKNGKYFIGPQICFEILFPELSRAMVNNKASFIVNITNDAWFGKTSAPFQHFSMCVFRAVENRRSLIRSANTGISGFIDPTGKILKSTQLFEEKILTHKMPQINIKTFYTTYGDIFAFFCMFLTCFFILQALYHLYLKKNK